MDTQTVKFAVDGANRSELARRTGLSLSGVSRILSAHRTARSSNLSDVALCLGVPMGELHTYLSGLRDQRLKRANRRRRTAAA